MPVDVLTEIEIRQPVEKGAAFAGDPDKAPERYVNNKSVDWKTPMHLRAGCKIAFKAHFLGRKPAYTYEFAEVVPNDTMAMRRANTKDLANLKRILEQA